MVMSGNRGIPDSMNRFNHLMFAVKILNVCLLKMQLPDLVHQSPSSKLLSLGKERMFLHQQPQNDLKSNRTDVQ